MNIDKDVLLELVDNIERAIILLEDNPKIKDVAGFYNGNDMSLELFNSLTDLKKEMLKEEV